MQKEKPGWRIIKYFIIISFLIWTVVPIMVILSNSFKRPIDIFSVPFVIFFKPILSNYIKAFMVGEFSRYFINSLIVAMSTSILSVGLGAFAAYGLTSFDLKLGKSISRIILIGKFVPSLTILIPLFVILSNMKLIGTFVGPILAHTAINLPFVIWLLMGFIVDVPKELISAAFIDGCGKLKILFKIILPIIAPAIASAFVLTMQYSWNELVFSLQLTNVNTYTLPVGISQFVGAVSVDWGKSSAAAAVTMIPVIIAGFFVQKYLVTGMTMGAVKG